MREADPDESVVAAAQWLADQAEPVRHVISMLRERFGITSAQAARACTLATTMRVLRRAHG